MKRFFRLWTLACVTAAMVGATAVRAQNADVQAEIVITRAGEHRAAAQAASTDVALWLKPAATSADAPPPPGRFRMAQKNKSFQPHFLVIPVGSTVSFPNLDPFFHNVFSQFNGKRFDLGLYEAGSTRDVRFDHEGVSFIFCNIHPEMSAVIIALTTPWYATVAGSGTVTLHNVPPGAYELHVWAEGADPRQLDALTRRVHVGAANADLGTIHIATSTAAAPHKNKFGDDYRPDAGAPY